MCPGFLHVVAGWGWSSGRSAPAEEAPHPCQAPAQAVPTAVCLSPPIFLPTVPLSWQHSDLPTRSQLLPCLAWEKRRPLLPASPGLARRHGGRDLVQPAAASQGGHTTSRRGAPARCLTLWGWGPGGAEGRVYTAGTKLAVRAWHCFQVVTEHPAVQLLPVPSALYLTPHPASRTFCSYPKLHISRLTMRIPIAMCAYYVLVLC